MLGGYRGSFALTKIRLASTGDAPFGLLWGSRYTHLQARVTIPTVNPQGLVSRHIFIPDKVCVLNVIYLIIRAQLISSATHGASHVMVF